MRQSLRLIDQIVGKFPGGPFNADRGVPLEGSTQREILKYQMEYLITHFKDSVEGFSVPVGSVYSAIEAPKGEFGVFLLADGSNRPYRCKVRSPGFTHLQGIKLMVEGHYLADLVTIIGTQDIVFGEVDR
jgi:NADH:ubiquinone oxidoreductase subunit D